MIINKKGNYRILAEKIKNLDISYNPNPYLGYSEETNKKVNEMRTRAKNDLSLFDGPGVRLSSYSFDKGQLNLNLDYTTYFHHVATRKNTNNEKDCARWFGCSGITFSKEGKNLFMWVGEKSNLNEIGSGEIQLLPAGGINPINDFGFDYAVKRELYEEALRKKPLYHSVKNNFEVELLGSRKRNIGKQVIKGVKRHFLDLDCRIKICEPYMLTDMVDISSFSLAHIVFLDMKNKEIKDSFNLIPENEREFNSIKPLEFRKNYLEDCLKSDFNKLRPQVRAAIDSSLRNYGYLYDKLKINKEG
jgi:hypothetical protein